VLLIKTSAFCWNNNCVIINMHGKTTLKKGIRLLEWQKRYKYYAKAPQYYVTRILSILLLQLKYIWIFKYVTTTNILAIKMSCHPKVTTSSASVAVTLNGLTLHFTDYISHWVYLAVMIRQVSSTSNRTIAVISVEIRRTLKYKLCSNLLMEICESHRFKENLCFLY
jgi:hypothetical protein